MASIWGELKRRNVVRVAMAYAVVAWLLLQVADVVLNNIEAPAWVFQAILLLIIIGFPLALTLAWAFELTPEGLKKEKDVDRSESITQITGRKFDFAIIGVLAIAVGFLLFDKLYLSDAVVPADEIISSERQSIAVLPFVNMSPDADQEYFSDGLSEEILNLLAKIPELKVIGRTSSFAFKGKNEDLRVIGRTLGVTTLLEGSVRKSGNDVRITAQLINASDASHIWSDTYDRTLTDIFAVQDDVATAIIKALQIHVGANPSRGRPTDNSEAYTLLLQARASFNAQEWADTEASLLQAIELDPEFAEAYEQLAAFYWSLSGQWIESAAGQQQTYSAAAKAIAIDPDLVYAQALYQAASIDSYSILSSIKALERAERRQAGDTRILSALSYVLLEAGYVREALPVAERNVELEPLLPSANNNLSEALYAAGRTGEAMAALEIAVQLGNAYDMWYMGEVNLVEKQDDLAIEYFEAGREEYGQPFDWVRELVNGARDPVNGQAYLDRRIPQIIAAEPEEERLTSQLSLARWYLYFGFLDRYFEEILNLDINDTRWTDANEFVQDGTVFRHLGFTAHPKYLEVAELLGIIDVWEQRGPPDFCEKVDGEWVCE